jgi:hypothetical protein
MTYKVPELFKFFRTDAVGPSLVLRFVAFV